MWTMKKASKSEISVGRGVVSVNSLALCSTHNLTNLFWELFFGSINCLLNLQFTMHVHLFLVNLAPIPLPIFPLGSQLSAALSLS